MKALLIRLLLLGIATALAFPGVSLGLEFGDAVSPAGQDELVLDGPISGTPLGCTDDPQSTDSPPRAVRGASGLTPDQSVQMTFSGNGGRRLTGPNLNVQRLYDCNRTYPPFPPPPPYPAPFPPTTFDPARVAPGSYWNAQWLTTPYKPGAASTSLIYGLVHNEFHGLIFDRDYGTDEPLGPDYCPGDNDHVSNPPLSVKDLDCWMSATVGAKSLDNGNSWNLDSAASPLVAALPFQYQSGWGAHGFTGPTNIVKVGQWFYTAMTVRTSSPPANSPISPQKAGVCLFRTNNLADASSWRAMDDTGHNFDRNMQSPYAVPPGVPVPVSRTCGVRSNSGSEPPGNGNLDGFTARGLTYNAFLKHFMLIGVKRQGTELGIYYSVSHTGGVTWEPLHLIVKSPQVAGSCASSKQPPAAYLYASLIDPSDATVNFERPGQSAYLYVVKSDSVDRSTCVPDPNDRSIIRFPLVFQPESQLSPKRVVTSGPDSASFDYVSGTLAANTDDDPEGHDYDADGGSVKAIATGSGGPYGRFDVTWPSGSDVWYGTGMMLGSGFDAGANDGAFLMRWEVNGNSNTYGGLKVRSANSYELVSVLNGVETKLGPPVTVHAGRWSSVEVHQRFSKATAAADAAELPINDVYVDGRLMSSSVTVNATPELFTINAVRYGFASGGAAGSELWLDRASIGTAQQGASAALDAAPEVPDKPAGVVGSPGNGLNLLWWNSSPDTYHRVYKQLAGGAWGCVYDSANFGDPGPDAWYEVGLANNQQYHYRVTAYKRSADRQRESIAAQVAVTPRAP